jgi:RimJ/RimL family protein N-acetyltransferase
VPLQTARLELLPLNIDRDADDLHAMLADPQLNEVGPTEPTRTVAQTREELARQVDRSGRTWVLRLRSEGKALGTIGLFAGQDPPICGLSWALRRDYWGRGLMGEAAPVVVEHLLGQPDIDGLEAWIDSRNRRSLGVARRAELSESARLPRVYDNGEIAQSIVMTRAARSADPDVLAVRARLYVADVTRTAHELVTVLGLHVSFVYPDPPATPRIARLGVGPWSGSPGIDVLAAGDAGVTPAEVYLDVGVHTDLIAVRARQTGVRIAVPVADQPGFGRRTCTLELTDGHRIVVAGPLAAPE